MGSLEVKTLPRRVYLLTIPRTASNLLVRMLNLAGQDEVVSNPYLGGYFYMQAFFDRNNLEMWHVPTKEHPEDKKAPIGTALQKSTDNLHALTESAEKENKIAFVKEHVPFITRAEVLEEIRTGMPADTIPAPWKVHIDPATDIHSPANPTYIPDNFLTTFTPVFLVRHPAVAFPSALRADFGHNVNFDDKPLSESDIACAEMLSSYMGVRRLYEFYMAQHHLDPSEHVRPTLIDASDLINHTQAVMYHFCDVTGIDKTKLKFEWKVATKDELAKQGSDVTRRFLSTISASTGVLKEKASNDLDIDVEVVKWREEFGLTMATNLERWVRRSMPDYEYLWDQRWSPVAAAAAAAATSTTNSSESA